MKRNYLYLSLILLALVGTSCGSRTSQRSIVDIADELDKAGIDGTFSEDAFPLYWNEFIEHMDDLSFLNRNIDFPYSDGFSITTKADSETANFQHAIPYYDSHLVEFGVVQENEYLNGNLRELFLEKFENLEHIHFVYKKSEPSGYYVYFRFDGAYFKFIGYEELYDAEN